MTIDAGSSKTAPFTWKRQPSAAGQCQANANKRITAAGAYWLTVSLGKVTSDGVQFLLK